MNGLQLINTPSKHCFKFIVTNVHLDWTSLIWIGLLIILFEWSIFLILRLKYIYIPPRFMIALTILSALILAEALPYVFLQLQGTC